MNLLTIGASLFEAMNLPEDVGLETFVATAAVMGLAMMAMAVGVIFQGKELKGSCGGAASGDDCFCETNGLPKACEQPDAA